MAIPICIEIPELPTPHSITLPGGAGLQHLDLLDAIQPALTPLMPLFDIIDAVVAVFACIKAIPDALGPPPDPSVLAACLPELGKKVSKLLRLLPQLSLPYTVTGILDLLIDTLTATRGQIVHLQQRLVRIQAAADRAVELGDPGLMAIVVCARTNVAQEGANIGRALASLAKLIAVLNVFLGLIGGPKAPDLSSLQGVALDVFLVPLDALVEVLVGVRKAIPLP